MSTCFGTKTYAQIMAEVRRLREAAGDRRYRIKIFSNILVTSLPTLLEWSFLQEGAQPEFIETTFDNIVQETAHLPDIDAAVVFMDLAGIYAAKPDLEVMSDDAFEQFARGVEESALRVLQNLGQARLATFNLLSAAPFESRRLRPGRLSQLADRVNALARATAAPSVVLVDLDKVFLTTGLATAIDFRQFHSARSLHTIDFLKNWVSLVFPAFRSVMGRARKVLVTDCDNTLWGGIIGEDGVEGVRLDESTRDGPFFREVHYILKGLQAQGVLLAAASKNNPNDVQMAFRENSKMILKESDFVAMEIGWDEKIHSLVKIAEDLNLGVDSLVFLDDSAFEIERVRSALPQVICLQVPEAASEYPRMMRDMTALFFNLSHSEEDLRRTQMYLEDAERKRAMSAFQSHADYVASLDVRVSFTEGESINIARAAQMSQKTNQFNLTTRRYTEADILRMARSDDYVVATFAVADRFGDYGIAGLVILCREGTTATLDTLLMSCRVLGRRVEETVFDWIDGRMRQSGISRIQGEFLPTSKNQQVETLLERFGFTMLSADENGRKYLRDLTV